MNVILNIEIVCTNVYRGLRCNYSSRNTRVMKEVLVQVMYGKNRFYVQKT